MQGTRHCTGNEFSFLGNFSKIRIFIRHHRYWNFICLHSYRVYRGNYYCKHSNNIDKSLAHILSFKIFLLKQTKNKENQKSGRHDLCRNLFCYCICDYSIALIFYLYSLVVIGLQIMNNGGYGFWHP